MSQIHVVIFKTTLRFWSLEFKLNIWSCEAKIKCRMEHHLRWNEKLFIFWRPFTHHKIVFSNIYEFEMTPSNKPFISLHPLLNFKQFINPWSIKTLMNATNHGKCLGMHFRNRYFITNVKNECHHFVNGCCMYKHHAIGHSLVLVLNYLAFAIK